MPRVLVVGYGVVGKRIADAVAKQNDMTLAGVVEVSPARLTKVASDRGYAIFAATDDAAQAMQKAGMSIAGNFADALSSADLVIDAAPKGVTAKNVAQYIAEQKPFIVNGGEKHSLTGFSFNALVNYKDAIGGKRTRVVSCNTTALCRVLYALQQIDTIEDAFVVVVRRGADPVRTDSGPINALVPVLGGLSHHAEDVRTVLDLPLTSLAVKASTTLAHLHMLRIVYRNPADATRAREALEKTPRIAFVSGAAGLSDTARVLEYYRDELRPRGDMWEVAVWEDSISADGRTLVLTYCVHMESIAVPENIDAARAMLGLQASAGVSVKATDQSLGFFKPTANYDF